MLGPRFALFFSLAFLLSCAAKPVAVVEAPKPEPPKVTESPPAAEAAQPLDLDTRTQVIMGTFISAALPVDQADSAEVVFSVFKQIDAKFSNYKDDSEVTRLNHRGSAVVSAELFNLIRRSLEISRQTEGAFDITLGGLTHGLYGFGTQKEKVPDEHEVEQARVVTGYEKLKVEGNKVSMPTGMALDFGGIAKGYAVDRAVERLEQKGVRAGFVAASGDIRCLHPCRVSIQHPLSAERDLVSFRAAKPGLSISTSGTYERMVPGTDVHHLLDPKTGRPQRNFMSVTLLTERDNATIDALATAVAVMPLDRAVTFLSSRQDLGFVLVTTDHWLFYNQRFLKLTTDLNWRLKSNEFRMIQVDRSGSEL